MKLLPNKNGTYTIKTAEEARTAFKLHLKREEQIAKKMSEAGIVKLMDESKELKKAASEFQIKKKLDRIELPDGRYAKRVVGGYDKRFIATDDELEAELGSFPDGARSLESILTEKFASKPKRRAKIWARVTKTTVDKTALDAVVSEGLLSAEELAPAFVEKEKQPYVRIYGSGEES
jgi:hypothetical protein